MLRKFRLPIAALLLGLAATVAVSALRPPLPPTAPLLTTTGALPAGTQLTKDDVKTVSAAPDTIPADGLTEVSAAVGRTLAVAVTPGTVLSAPVLVDPELGLVGPPGTVVAAVRLAEPGLVQFLSPGMHLDLLAPSGDATGSAGGATPASYLARGALVLPTPSAAAQEADGLVSFGGDPSATATDLVLVAVTPEEAALLANVAGWGVLSAVIVQ